MRIVVDDHKRRGNIAKHGIDLYDVDKFDWATIIVLSARQGRFMAIGPLAGTLVVVIFRPLGTEGLSIISMRPAGSKERRLHEQGPRLHGS